MAVGGVEGLGEAICTARHHPLHHQVPRASRERAGCGDHWTATRRCRQIRSPVEGEDSADVFPVDGWQPPAEKRPELRRSHVGQTLARPLSSFARRRLPLGRGGAPSCSRSDSTGLIHAVRRELGAPRPGPCQGHPLGVFSFFVFNFNRSFNLDCFFGWQNTG